MLGRMHAILYDQLSRNVYHRCKQLVGVRTAIRVKDAIRIRQLAEVLFLRQGYPEMCAATRVELRARFAEDILKLSNLTGRDLSHWQ